MEDYEIRDVMGRRQYPHIELEFEIAITQEVRRSGVENYLRYMPDKFGGSPKPEKVELIDCYTLKIWARNSGRVYAQYVDIFADIPDVLLPPFSSEESWEEKRETVFKEGVLYYEYFEDNTVRDVVDVEASMFGSVPKFGPARYTPILPGRTHSLRSLNLRNDFEDLSLDGIYIEWETSADNASPLKGKIAVIEIEIIDKRNEI